MGKRTYQVADSVYLFGSLLFALSGFMYFGFLELELLMPWQYSVGSVGVLMMMFAGLAASFWTTNTGSITYFGYKEWLITLLFVVFLLLPHAVESYWSDYELIASSVGVVSSFAFWMVAVRDSW